MKISVAQLRPVKGDVPANLNNHVRLIDLAASLNISALFFPELSLTGYEPALAQRLATTSDDERLDVLQQASDVHGITIGAGLPTKTESKPKISMVIFQPGQPRQTYSKQMLHADELPFFAEGDQQIVLTVAGRKIAPAICYESLQPEHFENAKKTGADIYLASVAKSQSGVDKAMRHFAVVSKTHSTPVLMSNCVGPCDNFESVGSSCVWSKQGHLVGRLDGKSEGLLIYDTETEEVTKHLL